MVEQNQEMILQKEILCPHCWHKFESEDLLWISESPDLVGDSKLGAYAKKRFLPMMFSLEGNAIDIKGYPCRKYACPHCHLEIPKAIAEFAPFMVSIAGAPSSGKSYFLSSMTYRLRKFFTEKFQMSFSDADPDMNARLIEYEDRQFINSDPNQYVRLKKTEEAGDLYDSVLISGVNMNYPKPFIFSLVPVGAEASAAQIPEKNRLSRAVTLYDNAGESFLPARSNDDSSMTVYHLRMSHSIFFLFDPLQDTRFRAACSGISEDPQLNHQLNGEFNWTPDRQEIILTETVNKTKMLRNINVNERLNIPVFFIVTKYDAWKKLLGLDLKVHPWLKNPEDGSTVLMKNYIEDVSDSLKGLFKQYLPEVLGMMEQFSTDITFVPVSATGIPPEQDPRTGNWGFRVGSIQPFWTEVPFLYALSKSSEDLISVRNVKLKNS